MRLILKGEQRNEFRKTVWWIEKIIGHNVCSNSHQKVESVFPLPECRCDHVTRFVQGHTGKGLESIHVYWLLSLVAGDP